MRCLAVFASVLLSANAYSAGSEDFDNAYSVVRAEGESPSRSVVVMRVHADFTSYRGFQINCESRMVSDTGFFSSPDAVMRALSAIKPSDGFFKLLAVDVWEAACGPERPTVVSDSVQLPKAS